MGFLSIAQFASGRNLDEAIASLRVRLASRMTVEQTGCHTVPAYNGGDGYGAIWFLGRMWYVHRLVWLLDRGEIPNGLVLDHLCRTRNCCNPDHLEVVTIAENNRRTPDEIRNRGASRRDVGRCRKGHIYTNKDIRATGHYDCTQCKRENQRTPEYKAKAKARRQAARAAKRNAGEPGRPQPRSQRTLRSGPNA